MDEEAVVTQRDCLIAKAKNKESSVTCTCTLTDPNDVDLDDTTLPILHDLINIQFAENSNNRNEPVCNSLPSSDNFWPTLY